MSENHVSSLAFGQAVIGPPGSGKTTYCFGMQEFMSKIGRKVAVVNLDPANEGTPYQCAVDISELITLSDVMDNLKLGPNGGLIYCMEYLEANFDWLQEKLAKLKGHYFLFDCPGQVELCTHHGALKNVFAQLAKWNFRLAAVHLVDSHYCTDPGKFISVLCTSLSTMLHVELPHVNVLSKMDLIEQYGKLAFNLDYYTEVLDLSYLVDHLATDPFFKNYRRLNEKLVEVIEDYSLVSFVPLNVQTGKMKHRGPDPTLIEVNGKTPIDDFGRIGLDLERGSNLPKATQQDKESMRRVMQAVDKANGYSFGDLEQRSLEVLMSAAVGADFHFTSTLAVQEKYVQPQEKTVEQEAMEI